MNSIACNLLDMLSSDVLQLNTEKCNPSAQQQPLDRPLRESLEAKHFLNSAQVNIVCAYAKSLEDKKVSSVQKSVSTSRLTAIFSSVSCTMLSEATSSLLR
jgi:hypothetical protein